MGIEILSSRPQLIEDIAGSDSRFSDSGEILQVPESIINLQLAEDMGKNAQRSIEALELSE